MLWGRSLAVGAVALATLAVAVTLLSAEGDLRLHVRLENASGLVEGNLVQVGGVSIGEVQDIELTDRSEADVTLVITESRFLPLRAGTQAVVRVRSLSSVAGRVIALRPGPATAPPLDDGATIPVEDTRATVELDQIVNTLDAATRASLQQLVHGGAAAFGGDPAELNAALTALNPAFAEARRTSDRLLASDRELQRFLVQSAAVVSALAERSADVEAGVVSAARATEALAAEDAGVDTILRGGAGTVRRANTTLVDLRAALRDVRPALRAARPVAPRLAGVLRAVRPLTARAGPLLDDVAELLPVADRVLRGLPELERSARPAFGTAGEALSEATPVLSAARAYTPDVVAGLLNGFGGTTAGYYDANGHYARISIQGNPYSLSYGLSLLGAPPSDGTVTGWRRGVLARCPGAAAQPHPDRSNPWAPPEAPCRPEDGM